MGPVSIWTGGCFRAGKPSGYVTNHLGRLSLLPSAGWYNEYQLSGWVIINGDGGCCFIAAYRRANGWSPLAWSKGRQPSGAVLHSLCEWVTRHIHCPGYYYYYITRSTQPSIPPGKVNQVLACLAGAKVGCVHLCRVAGNTVWSHMANDTL